VKAFQEDTIMNGGCEASASTKKDEFDSSDEEDTTDAVFTKRHIPIEQDEKLNGTSLGRQWDIP
jgi:hypothetical protein